MPKQRATLEEVKEFANAVREAGGGNPLDALMPAVPEDPHQCLIAKNLNFDCWVEGAEEWGLRDDRWVMVLEDKKTRDRIADKLGLAKRNREGYYGRGDWAVVLPPRIGQVARDFDRSVEIFHNIEERVDDERAWNPDTFDWENAARRALKACSKHDRRLLRELIPYVEEASAEARRLATIVNEDGSIVL